MSGYACGGAGEPCDAQHRPYFRPYANLTRGQLAKIVANAAALSAPVTGQTFADIPAGQPFYLYVERAVRQGILGGYACGGAGEPCDPGRRPYFRPQQSATRGQTAKIVANTAFPDNPAPAP